MLEIMEEKLLLKELWALESLSLIVAAWPLILLCRSESTLEVRDQVGSPTSTKELAGAIAHLLFTENYGLFHATCEGSCSWADFSREIFRLAGKPTEVVGITTEEFGAKAPRPAYSILENYMLKLTTDYRFADWHDAIALYMKELL